jgi:hypothetical protein
MLASRPPGRYSTRKRCPTVVRPLVEEAQVVVDANHRPRVAGEMHGRQRAEDGVDRALEAELAKVGACQERAGTLEQLDSRRALIGYDSTLSACPGETGARRAVSYAPVVPEWDEVFADSSAPPRPPPRRKSNSVGIAGFVCGLISLLLSLIPLFFLVVSGPIGIAGVILSVKGRRRAAEGAPSGRLATAGLVLSIVSLAWTFVIWFVAVLL